MFPRHGFWLLCVVVIRTGLVLPQPSRAQSSSFINFETAPVHPVALSPDGHTLAVCNLPDGRVELFDVATGIPTSVGNVPVGVDPVSLRFRGTNELWVVNYISSSVDIVDVSRRRVVAMLSTFAGPADIAFAGVPERAFVSCARSNVVMVVDPITRTSITNIAINGDRPKAMAVGPGDSKVYIAIFESGNASTILTGRRDVNLPVQPTVVDATNGPYAGQNPPPNSGSSFAPPINPGLTTSLPVGHIVKKNAAGRWMDGNNTDWTGFVSGTNAPLSSRVPGWDLPDRDVAVIDTATLNVSYLSRLLNICMDLAVNPVSGKLAVVGTDALNELRFEPNLQSKFIRVNLALVDPVAQTNLVKDLNPHLDYSMPRVPQSERNKSLGDPRGVVWSADGTRCYVTGMGSQNLVVLDADGNRVQVDPVPLQEGPTGLALDEARQRLYVLNRFSASVSVVDLASSTVVTNIGFFDPTPAAIKAGRRLLYDTHSNSGLGQAACASCHVDGRFDRLAWDLGDPSGSMITNQFGTFHPMKGPMVTQTFQGVNPDGPLHWRADREGIVQFNQTFVKLLGRDAEPTQAEDDEFAALLRTIFFPPNPLRNFDNTLSTNMPLPGHVAYDVALRAPGSQPLPNGNARRGAMVFSSRCSSCHNPGSGLGNPSANSIVTAIQRESSNVFKIAQLRSLVDKAGMDLTRQESRAGFGFGHDGGVDTLSRLLGDGFGTVTNTQDAADVIAFLLSFAGSEIAFSGLEGAEAIESDLDGPAALGFQTLLTNATVNGTVLAMISLAEAHFPRDLFNAPPPTRLELIARGGEGMTARGWHYTDGYFQSDRGEETLSAANLFRRASPTNELMLMLVSRGTGRRISTDRDGDGARDLTEAYFGFDPLNTQSRPANLPLLPVISIAPYSSFARLDAGQTYSNAFMAYGISNYGTPDEDYEDRTGLLNFLLTGDAPAGAVIDPIEGTFSWTPSPQQMGQELRIAVRVGYAMAPTMSEIIVLRLTVNGPVFLEPPRIDGLLHQTIIRVRVPDDRIFRVQYSDDTGSPSPVWSTLGFAYGEIIDTTWPPRPRRLYRAVFDP